MSATLVDGLSMERFSRPIASMSRFVSRLSPPSHSSTRLQSACSPAASPGPSATGRWARRIKRRTCGWICGCIERTLPGSPSIVTNGDAEAPVASRTAVMTFLSLRRAPVARASKLPASATRAHADDVDAGDLQRRPRRSGLPLAVLIAHHVDVGHDLQRGRRGRGLDLFDELLDGSPHGWARNVVRLVGDRCGCDGGFKESVAVPPRIVHSRVDCPAFEPVRECCIQRPRQGTFALNGVSEVVASDLDPRPMRGSRDHPFLSQDLERLSQYVAGERAKRRLVLRGQRKSHSLLRGRHPRAATRRCVT